jgi:hypothetical protein
MEVNIRDSLGRTALHRVLLRETLREGHKEVIKILSTQRAGIKLSDNYGRTPLSLARRNGHLGLIEGITRDRQPAETGKTRPSITLQNMMENMAIKSAEPAMLQNERWAEHREHENRDEYGKFDLASSNLCVKCSAFIRKDPECGYCQRLDWIIEDRCPLFNELNKSAQAGCTLCNLIYGVTQRRKLPPNDFSREMSPFQQLDVELKLEQQESYFPDQLMRYSLLYQETRDHC